MSDVTIEELLKLITVKRKHDGTLFVVSVHGNVEGDVEGDVFGHVHGWIGGHVLGDVHGTEGR